MSLKSRLLAALATPAPVHDLELRLADLAGIRRRQGLRICARLLCSKRRVPRELGEQRLLSELPMRHGRGTAEARVNGGDNCSTGPLTAACSRSVQCWRMYPVLLPTSNSGDSPGQV